MGEVPLCIPCLGARHSVRTRAGHGARASAGGGQARMPAYVKGVSCSSQSDDRNARRGCTAWCGRIFERTSATPTPYQHGRDNVRRRTWFRAASGRVMPANTHDVPSSHSPLTTFSTRRDPAASLHELDWSPLSPRHGPRVGRAESSLRLVVSTRPAAFNHEAPLVGHRRAISRRRGDPERPSLSHRRGDTSTTPMAVGRSSGHGLSFGARRLLTASAKSQLVPL